MIMCHNVYESLIEIKKFKIEVRLHCIDIKDEIVQSPRFIFFGLSRIIP